MAAINEGIDWKAVSHALRAVYQVKSIFTEGTIIFPLPEAEFLKQVKAGDLQYTDIAPILEDGAAELRVLRDASDFPEEVDKEYWEEFLVNCLGPHVYRFVE